MSVEIKIRKQFFESRGKLKIISLIKGEKKWTVMRTIGFAAETSSTVGRFDHVVSNFVFEDLSYSLKSKF